MGHDTQHSVLCHCRLSHKRPETDGCEPCQHCKTIHVTSQYFTIQLEHAPAQVASSGLLHRQLPGLCQA